MTTFLAIIGAWFLASIPFGIMMARFCSIGQDCTIGQDRDLTEHLIVPRDRGEQ